jgi:hypothetical protein
MFISRRYFNVIGLLKYEQPIRMDTTDLVNKDSSFDGHFFSLHFSSTDIREQIREEKSHHHLWTMSSCEETDATGGDSVEAMYARHSLSIFIFVCMYREQRQFQARPDTYNGADRDHYSWTQTIADLDVRVKVNVPSLTINDVVDICVRV